MPELFLERVDFISLVDTPAVPDATFAVKKSADESGDREIISKHVDAPAEPTDTTMNVTESADDDDDELTFDFTETWVSDQSEQSRPSIVQKINAEKDTERMSDTYVADGVEQVND